MKSFGEILYHSLIQYARTKGVMSMKYRNGNFVVYLGRREEVEAWAAEFTGFSRFQVANAFYGGWKLKFHREHFEKVSRLAGTRPRKKIDDPAKIALVLNFSELQGCVDIVPEDMLIKLKREHENAVIEINRLMSKR